MENSKFRTWKDMCGFTLGYIGQFYGIEGIALISHGGWCDPELYYKGKSYNYYDVEDAMWGEFQEEHSDVDCVSDEPFSAWMLWNQEYVREYIEELDSIGSYYGAPSYAIPVAKSTIISAVA